MHILTLPFISLEASKDVLSVYRPVVLFKTLKNVVENVVEKKNEENNRNETDIFMI